MFLPVSLLLLLLPGSRLEDECPAYSWQQVLRGFHRFLDEAVVPLALPLPQVSKRPS